MKLSNVFRLAKQNLSSSYDDASHWRPKYICYAIADSIEAPMADKVRAAKIVQGRLCGARTVEDWLEDRSLVPLYYYATKDRVEIFDQIQQYRHRWVDSLILEFEAKGQ
jgi:hypothetical protein